MVERDANFEQEGTRLRQGYGGQAEISKQGSWICGYEREFVVWERTIPGWCWTLSIP